MKVVPTAAVIVLACAFATVANADVLIPGYFGGIVDDGTYTNSGPENTTFIAGEAISGSLVFDATTSAFTSFEIVIAHPAPASASGRLADSTKRTVSSTKARLALAVLTTERKAA